MDVRVKREIVMWKLILHLLDFVAILILFACVLKQWDPPQRRRRIEALRVWANALMNIHLLSYVHVCVVNV